MHHPLNSLLYQFYTLPYPSYPSATLTIAPSSTKSEIHLHRTLMPHILSSYPFSPSCSFLQCQLF
jgi:hypothetical protein